MRTILFGILLMVTACRRPSTQFAAMLTPTNQPEIADYSNYLKAGDMLIATGHEPAWSLTINSSKNTLRFNALDGDSLIAPVPKQQTNPNGSFHYTIQAQDNQFTIAFTPDSCTDKLSGQRFDYRVEAVFRGKTYQGCGVSLQQVALLQDIWILTELDGQAISTSQEREVPRLELSLTENRVTGTTGCNRLSGSVRADTHLIRFGPLVTTKMACIGNGNAIEAKFLNVLTQPLAYQISTGRLTLWQQGKAVAVLKKGD
ncbi:META domain-containing protein [Spirosoma sp. SC4-14]|uniref:META domain-containing protein n=1 Tax=Spirosoma sp. SC4-14 TaxID=3128900 RepID=UPI0030D0E7CB